ncbi:hypothetical protein [Streptomyces canus]|uniref:hypothetical protein n=1 Tax=Streptomyces canus TaxID=58343 RepID=UPI000376E6EE|nr:hypothetical protein [Streptomyces canus]
MSPSPDEFRPTPGPAFSAHARDRGLRRSRRTTVWIAATAAAGAAALGGVYTHLIPGGPAAPAPAPVHQPATSHAATPAGKDDGGREKPNGHEADEEDGEQGAAPAAQPAPQPPAQPPAATQQQPQTTTGAS